MIQYIRVETDDDGTIVGLGFGDQGVGITSGYSAVKKILSEASGLPQGVPTKDHVSKIKEAASQDCLYCASTFFEVKKKLAAESGLTDFCTVEEHLAVIKAKAQREGAAHNRDLLLHILSEHSGLVFSNEVGDHIAAIKLKAYDEGYDDGRRDMRTDIQERMKKLEEAIKSE